MDTQLTENDADAQICSVGQLIDDLSAPMGKARAAMNCNQLINALVEPVGIALAASKARSGLILDKHDRAWLDVVAGRALAEIDATIDPVEGRE